MEPKAVEQAANPTGLTWQQNRMDIEKQWHTALTNEASDIVPSKLPISTPPIRRAA